jgi:hypothetical protein
MIPQSMRHLFTPAGEADLAGDLAAQARELTGAGAR